MPFCAAVDVAQFPAIGECPMHANPPAQGRLASVYTKDTTRAQTTQGRHLPCGAVPAHQHPPAPRGPQLARLPSRYMLRPHWSMVFLPKTKICPKTKTSPLSTISTNFDGSVGGAGAVGEKGRRERGAGGGGRVEANTTGAYDGTSGYESSRAALAGYWLRA